MRPAAAAATATAAALLSTPPPFPVAASCLLPPCRFALLLPPRRLCSAAPPHASAAPDSLPPPVMDVQFESFRAQLDESSALRDRIRAVVAEVESASRVATAALLLVHQPVPLAGSAPSLSPISCLLGNLLRCALVCLVLSCLPLAQMCLGRRGRRWR
jgi:hypothetical protein